VQQTAQPAYRLADRAVDRLVVETLQETILASGSRARSQVPTPGAIRADLGFANGPVFLTHQAENREQLRLGKLAIAQTTAIARKHHPSDLQSEASKRQECDFGHRTSCLHRKPPWQSPPQPSRTPRGCQPSQMASFSRRLCSFALAIPWHGAPFRPARHLRHAAQGPTDVRRDRGFFRSDRPRTYFARASRPWRQP
jgi:hypothetical protein